MAGVGSLFKLNFTLSSDTSWFWGFCRTCILHTAERTVESQCPLKHKQSVDVLPSSGLLLHVIRGKAKCVDQDLAGTLSLLHPRSPPRRLPRGPAPPGKHLRGPSHLGCRSQCGRFPSPLPEIKRTTCRSLKPCVAKAMEGFDTQYLDIPLAKWLGGHDQSIQSMECQLPHQSPTFISNSTYPEPKDPPLALHWSCQT